MNELIKKYVNLQAEDHAIWFEAEHISEAYLQQALRNLHYLIEEATEEQALEMIKNYNEE